MENFKRFLKEAEEEKAGDGSLDAAIKAELGEDALRNLTPFYGQSIPQTSQETADDVLNQAREREEERGSKQYNYNNQMYVIVDLDKTESPLHLYELSSEPGAKEEFDNLLNGEGYKENTKLTVPRSMAQDPLNEEKEMADDSEIEEIIIKVLNKEGGAAGLDPIEKALKGKVADDFNLVAFLKGMRDSMVKKHKKGDYIEMTGLEEAEELEEKRFANDPNLDKDGDGVPKWADKDDNDPEVGSKKKVKNEVVSEHLSYHLKNKLSLTESVFRAGSDAYIDLVKEARVLWKMGGYQPKIEELELLQSDIGQFGIYEGEKVPLDTPMLNEVELEEAKKKKKKNPPLNKPSLNTGGGKKWKVYVRSKSGGIKKVTFGDKKGGLKGNWNDPEARASFAKRHKCAEKKDKTKAGYWACRAHKYFGKNVPGRFW